MENDLIRRSDAENIFRSARRAMKPENYSGQEFFIRDNILLNAEQIVHSIPAVDAVEVRHEEWMSYFVGCNIKTVCTNCGEQIPPPYMSHEYCSKCGARMDGRREEGDK